MDELDHLPSRLREGLQAAQLRLGPTYALSALAKIRIYVAARADNSILAFRRNQVASEVEVDLHFRVRRDPGGCPSRIVILAPPFWAVKLRGEHRFRLREKLGEEPLGYFRIGNVSVAIGQRDRLVALRDGERQAELAIQPVSNGWQYAPHLLEQTQSEIDTWNGNGCHTGQEIVLQKNHSLLSQILHRLAAASCGMDDFSAEISLREAIAPTLRLQLAVADGICWARWKTVGMVPPAATPEGILQALRAHASWQHAFGSRSNS